MLRLRHLRHAILLTAALAALPLALSASQNRHTSTAKIPKTELSELSAAIKAAPIYQRAKELRIDSLVDRFNAAPTASGKWEIAMRLADTYRLFNTDSALHYASKARNIAMRLDNDQQLKTDILLVKVLSTAGIFTNALSLFDRMASQPMSPEIKCDYWIAGRTLYSYMRTYVDGQSYFYDKYSAQYFQYDDSLIAHLPADNRFREFIVCERLVNEGNYRTARQRLENLLRAIPDNSTLANMAMFQLAEVYRNQGQETFYAALLAKSATGDIKNCVKEGMALPTLAHWLYEQGELSDAFSYINFALEDAMNGNARMRMVAVAQMMPLIDDAYREKINSSRDEMMVYFLLVTFLLIISGVLLTIILRQMRRSRATARKLALNTKRQESYISNFLELYSTYAEKLNRLMRQVSVKLAAGQTAELLKWIESGKFVDEDNDIFDIFDTAFLDMFPDFINQVNHLLRPEEQITVKIPGTLTPELRIYALIRLGVDEMTRVAKILHYSVNTVYAYRNRIRNKAVSRETFDEEVAKIDGFLL